MPIHGDVTNATATGDTTETSIGTVTFSSKAKKIIGVWCYAIAGAALTTAEAATGFFRLDSGDLNLAPAKFPLAIVNALTSGVAALNPQIIPVDIPVKGLEKIEVFVTMDMAQTGALKARAGFIYEGD
jgi:hypothetical protein